VACVKKRPVFSLSQEHDIFRICQRRMTSGGYIDLGEVGTYSPRYRMSIVRGGPH